MKEKRNIRGLVRALEQDETRAAAFDALIEIGEDAVEPLCMCLNATRPDLRAYAARALGRIADARAVAPLYDVVVGTAYSSGEGIDYGDLNAVARKYAIDALRRIGGEEATEALLKARCLLDGRQRRMVERCLSAMGTDPAQHQYLTLSREYWAWERKADPLGFLAATRVHALTGEGKAHWETLEVISKALRA